MAVSNSTDRFNGVVASKAIKVPCKVASAANLTLSGEQTVAGVAVVTGDRVLVRAQTDASENGIYVVDSSGWERAADWDGARDIVQGTLATAFDSGGNAFQYIVTTADPITIGTTAVAIEIYTSGASAVIDPGTEDGSMLRWDTGGGGWVEQTLVKATPTGEFQVYEPGGTDYLQIDYVGTTAVISTFNPSHTIEIQGSSLAMVGGDVVISGGDLVLAGGSITGGSWLIPYDTPIEWEDETTPTPVPQELLIFTGAVPGGTPTPDPNLGDVSLLISAENGSGNTFISDIGPAFSPVETGSATCAIVTDPVKFGEQALRCIDFTGPNNSYWECDTVASAAFDFGSDDFTIEFHWRNANINSGGPSNIMGIWDFGTDRSWNISIVPSTGSYRTQFSYSTSGTNTLLGTQKLWGLGAQDTWYHIAVCRDGANLRYFVDGSQVGTTDSMGANTIHPTSTLALQLLGHTGSGTSGEMYLDNVRFTKGFARYTGNFTAPAAPFDGSTSVNRFVVGDPNFDTYIDGSKVILSSELETTAQITSDSTILTTGDIAVSDGTDRLTLSAAAGAAIFQPTGGMSSLELNIATHVSDTLRVGTSLYIDEAAAAAGDVAGQGQFWVRNDVPNVPMFTDDDGTDYNLVDPGASALTITAGWSTGGAGSLTIAANAPLFYAEQGGDDSPGSGQGQLWLRTGANPNQFFATDEGSRDWPLNTFHEQQFAYSSTITSGEPGPTVVRFNSLTPASITEMYIDTDSVSEDWTWILSNLAIGDVLTVRSAEDLSGVDYLVVQVDGTVVDETGWFTVPVAVVHSDTIFSDGDRLHFQVQWLSQASAGIGGSIANNQIAIGAATADEIEGDTNLTWDGTTLELGGAGKQLLLNGPETVPTAPTIGFGTGGDTGFYERGANILAVSVGGTEQFNWNGAAFHSALSEGGGILNETASATNPTLIPRRATEATGIGANAADELSVICGGVEMVRFVEAADDYAQFQTPMLVAEGSAAVGDIAGYGQLWVRDTAPNTLMFTDDTGVDYPVAGIAAVQRKVKTAEETRTSNNTMTDDNHLVGFALEAGAFYRIEAMFVYEHYQDPDFKYRFNFSNTPVANAGWWQDQVHPDNASSLLNSLGRAITTQHAITNAVNAVDHVVRIFGFFQANATTGGTLDFQWAQNTSNAQAITARIGSYMLVEKMD